MKRIVIVGAGVAGLALAHALKRRSGTSAGIEVLVLEKSARAGGHIRSDRIDGYLCEWGPNGFLDSVPATLGLVRELGIEDHIQVSNGVTRRRFIYRRGRLHPFPGNVGELVGSELLTWAGKLRMFAEPLAATRSDGDETIHAFAARRIGREAAHLLVGSMVLGMFGGDAARLSLRACFPRVGQMEAAYGSLFRAMLALRREKKRRGERTGGAGPSGSKASQAVLGAPAGRLTSFREGMEELVRALLRELGSAVMTNAPVTNLNQTAAERPAAQGSARRFLLDVQDREPFDADAVVFAGSAPDTASILERMDPEMASTLREIEAAPIAVVCLGYETSSLRRPLDGFGFLVPRGEGPRILGALWDSSIFSGRAPEGRVLIRVMIGGATDPDAASLSDEALVRTARTDLARTMVLDAAPAFDHVFRHPLGIPQYTVGHLHRLEGIRARLSSHPGLFLAGSSYRGISSNSCIEDAHALAAPILAFLDQREGQ